MKKVCIIACSLLMAAALALGIASPVSTNIPQEALTLCDMDYGYIGF